MKTFTSTLVLLATACSQEETDPGPPYRAQVLVMDENSDIKNGSPSFSIMEQEIKFLRKLSELDGDYIRIRFGGLLKIKNIAGSQVDADGFSGASKPRLRYKIKNGVIIPRDYSTLVTLSTYTNFGKIFEQMESITGESPNQFKEWAGKIDVLYEPLVTLEASGGNADVTYKLNAGYIPVSKQFGFFRRSLLEDLPLSTNILVIAHEFAHALFDKFFYKERSHDASDLYQNIDALRGINEGFADFYSFANSAITNILQASINIPARAKERDFKEVSFRYSDSNLWSQCSGGFYCYGTLFANALFLTMKTLGIDVMDRAARHQFTNKLVNSLNSSLERMQALEKSLYPNLRSTKFPNTSEGQKSEDGIWMGLFFNAFLTGLTPDIRAPLCSKLIANFGTIGFPINTRVGVCS